MNPKFEELYQKCYKDLTENLLPWWMTYGVDEKYGGWWGAVDYDNKPIEGHSKFITLAARLVWTFSSAYRILGDEKYKAMAKRAYDYLLEHFYDKKNGGWYSRVDYKGDVIDDHKYIYGNAFAIYGLSEYNRAFGDKEALRLALETRDLLEKYDYDKEYKGFYESCTADWKVAPWIRGMNRSPFDVKTMNTHLHLLEAYTCLARVDDSNKTRNSLRQQLYVMLNKIVNQDIHHYYYFQGRDWAPTTNEISYGHDIEGSWLMMETVDVLGEPECERAARDICVGIAKACYETGRREDGGMLSEFSPNTGEVSPYISWWEQNEGVVGFVNLWEETGDEKYLDAALGVYDCIDKLLIDHEKGGWFSMLSYDGKKPWLPNKQDDGVCPYHNGRMCFEIIERYRRHLEKGE